MTIIIWLFFFDEFDSDFGGALGWLKYFLAPMNDSEFFDGSDTFHIGPAIFVFAGGTASTFIEFEELASKNKAAKAIDFVSRLRGHLDIKAISNPGREVDCRTKVRRALILRSLLKRGALSAVSGNDINIDRALIHAFLNIDEFKHGTRSIQAIIEMSRIHEIGSFQRSSLPTKSQLDMHVDSKRFLELVNG